MRPAPILVDPLVDCVFKALLADPANQDLLLDFLNGVLRPTAPITAVTILNPYNPAEFVGGKETIVDVKATDSEGVVYQIELQGDAQRDLALYQSRVDYLHVQRTLEVEREEDAARLAELEAALLHVQAEKEKVQAEKEQERAEKEQERAEKERFRRLLLAAGIDPDTSSN